MKFWIRYTLIFTTIFILIIFMSNGVDAQCSMCRMAAESNLEQGGTSGKGLNKGILYMLIVPYISISTIAYLLYRRRKSKAELEL